MNWSHDTLLDPQTTLRRAIKQSILLILLASSHHICFPSPFSCGLRVLCFPSLWVCLGTARLGQRQKWKDTNIRKNKTKQKKGLLLQDFQCFKPGVGILWESRLSQNPRPSSLDKQPQGLHPHLLPRSRWFWRSTAWGLAGVLSTNKLAAGAGTWPCCSSDMGRQPHVPPQPSPTPALTQFQPPVLFFPSGHTKRTLKVSPVSFSRLSAAVGSTCPSHLCIPSRFLHGWLRVPRSQPGKQLSAQVAFSPPKLFLLRAEVGKDRQPGQRCSNKPSSFHAASAVIVFLRSFAAASHLVNAFPQPSDFKVVAGHFAAEQTPLEMPGSVSNPNSEGLLPAFPPSPAAAWQQ